MCLEVNATNVIEMNFVFMCEVDYKTNRFVNAYLTLCLSNTLDIIEESNCVANKHKFSPAINCFQ